MTPSVLMIPDAYGRGESGGESARHQAQAMRRLGWRVGVFSPDIPRDAECRDGEEFPRTPFTASANYRPRLHRLELESVIDRFRPSHVFSVGGVINRPLCYFDLLAERRIPHVYLIYCQDFYCTRIHAALADGPCTRCLTGTKLNAFVHGCATKTQRNRAVFLGSNTVNRARLQGRLRRVDRLLGSTREQLGFLASIGARPEQLDHFPLPFPESRISGVTPRRGDAIVVAGQIRIEKGIHLLRHLVPDAGGPAVHIALASRDAGSRALRDHGLQPLVDEGRLVPHYDMTWNTGLKELYAGALGVLIPSLWPTTTEFALLEALGMGKPVLCFNVGVHAERIIDGRNGLVAGLGEFDGLRSRMVALQRDPAMYGTLSRGARDLYDELAGDDVLERHLRRVIN